MQRRLLWTSLCLFLLYATADMPRRYFIIHGVRTTRFDDVAIADRRPWLTAVTAFEHFPTLVELRLALAQKTNQHAGSVRITGWNEVQEDEAMVYLNPAATTEAAVELHPPVYPGDCVIL